MREVVTVRRAEDALKRALDSVGLKWQLNAGDGAFYGPKIDIDLMDAMHRKSQVSGALSLCECVESLSAFPHHSTFGTTSLGLGW
jgi:hypothetical protein